MRLGSSSGKSHSPPSLDPTSTRAFAERAERLESADSPSLIVPKAATASTRCAMSPAAPSTGPYESGSRASAPSATTGATGTPLAPARACPHGWQQRQLVTEHGDAVACDSGGCDQLRLVGADAERIRRGHRGAAVPGAAIAVRLPQGSPIVQLPSPDSARSPRAANGRMSAIG